MTTKALATHLGHILSVGMERMNSKQMLHNQEQLSDPSSHIICLLSIRSVPRLSEDFIFILYAGSKRHLGNLDIRYD